ncbi:DUF1183-domain-containing protein [Phellopilus nigrolimitatus]|nr:DUF1183-domain-containing protein [Phellopilus nigrolimitatus]
MARVALSKIRTLTLHKDELTKSRRLHPILQLKCVGSACKLYQPEVVRCYNAGGEGAEVDWTCEADLPEKLRFGRIEVSCEGWDYAGDPYVLKGSCGLEYRLVNLSDGGPFKASSFFQSGLLCLSIFLALYLLYLAFKPYIRRFYNWVSGSQGPPRPPSSRPSEFYAGRPNRHDYPPPPYSAHPKPSTSSGAGSSGSSSAFQPGFWSGLGMGGLGGLVAARAFGGNRDQSRSAREYDWERERGTRGRGLFGSSSPFVAPAEPSRGPSVVIQRESTRNDNRAEGPSNLGSMRRSTGYGVSNVR